MHGSVGTCCDMLSARISVPLLSDQCLLSCFLYQVSRLPLSSASLPWWECIADVLGMVRWIRAVGAVHCRIGSGVLTAVPPCPPCAHCLRTSHLLSIALVECANLFPERILLILTRCVRLSSEKSACAKVRPVRPVRKCERRAEVRREARARAKVRPV